MRLKAVHIGMFLLGLLVLIGLVWLALGGGEARFAVAAPLVRQVDWWTMDGGGETSTGATYSVSGTIGQPDAGPPGAMSGGSYSVAGGFWAGVGVDTEYGLYLPLVRR